MKRRDRTMNTSLKILVVDDFATMRKIATKMLGKLGFENVVQAASGKDAWDLMQAEKVDIVLTDWNMPEMTGLELLIEIRSDERFKGLPVVLITAEAERDSIVSAIEKGASGYILKPFNIDKLQGIMEKYAQ